MWPGTTVAVFVLGVAMAGCLSPEEAPEPEATHAEPVGAAPSLPPNISANETVLGPTRGAGALSSGACGQLRSGPCYRYTVELDHPATMDAHLEWEDATNDFDLIVFSNGRPLEASADLPPGTEESLTVPLGRGSHDLLVVAHLVSMDTFELWAGFARE